MSSFSITQSTIGFKCFEAVCLSNPSCLEIRINKLSKEKNIFYQILKSDDKNPLPRRLPPAIEVAPSNPGGARFPSLVSPPTYIPCPFLR